MSSAPSPQEIAADAAWLAQAMDPASGKVRLVRMTAEDYRTASFLDDRLFQAPREHYVLPWGDAVSGFDATGRPGARWIFHIGHVGSTLLSRLIGELPGVLSVREPRLLRDLASVAQPEPYLAGARQLLSRTFAREEVAVVKATSFVSELAVELAGDNGRAIFIYAGPRAYLGTSLAGENTMKEVMALAPSRRQRMAGRVRLAALLDRPAYHVAAAWACEMTSLETAAAMLDPAAILWLDFDELLADVEGNLARAAGFLGIDAPADHVQAIARGPLMRRYSKALEYDYSPQLRRDLIASATATHSDDIAGALAMLDTAAQDSPSLARALERSAVER